MATVDTDAVKAKKVKTATDTAAKNQATSEVDIKKLLESGAHFGHKTSR